MPDSDDHLSQAGAAILAAAATVARQGDLAGAAEVAKAFGVLLAEIVLLREQLSRRARAVEPDPKPQPRRPVPARTGGPDPPAEGSAP